MKQHRKMHHLFPLPISVTFGILALLTAAIFAAPQAASAAGTAANARIVNTVTVNYQNALNQAQAAVTAQSTITVTLVKAAPNLAVNTGTQTIDTSAAATYTYTITSAANGPDSYTITQGTVTYSPPSGVSSSQTVPASISLGATSVAAAASAGATSITVPSDGASDSAINGITGTSTIVINNHVYSVTAITDNASGTSTITISGGLAATINIGDSIYEQKTFNVVVTPGAITATTNPTIQVPITAASSASQNSATVTTTTTVNVPNLGVIKEVSTDGTTWGTTANAAPSTTLYYRITVTNGGSSTANSVVITDPLTIYTTYVSGSGKMSTTTGQSYGAAPTTLTEGSGGYAYAAGSGITYSPGSVAAGASIVLFFKATIN